YAEAVSPVILPASQRQMPLPPTAGQALLSMLPMERGRESQREKKKKKKVPQRTLKQRTESVHATPVHSHSLPVHSQSLSIPNHSSPLSPTAPPADPSVSPLSPSAPIVSISLVPFNSQPGPGHLLCSGMDFYPAKIQLSWSEGQQELSGHVVATAVTTTRTGPSSSRCQVEHVSLEHPLSRHWGTARPPQHQGQQGRHRGAWEGIGVCWV
uniref:Ig-like domain-containing protein n=1 Tax=Cyanistes caeruleus TaxID=156563 RepID=A0A8C0UCI7_CYACU